MSALGGEGLEQESIRRIGNLLPVPVSVLDTSGRSVWANEAYCDLVKMPFEDVMTRTVQDAVHPDDLPAWEEALARAIAGEIVEVELRTLDRQGNDLQVVYAIRHEPVSGRVYAVSQDITDHRRAARVLHHAATHDALTDVANRAAALTQLDAWLADGVPVAVAVVDVDGFKLINDRMGHRVGDEVLRALARRIEAAAPEGGVVGRMGGDEFVVLARGTRGDATPAALDALSAGLAERLHAVSGEVTVLGRRVRLSVSVGATAALDGDAEGVLHEADTAASSAKRQGPGRMRSYDADLRRWDSERAAMERRLSRALARGQMTAHLQPVVKVDGGDIRAVEALSRMATPDGVVAAGRFIEAADHLGAWPRISWRTREAAFAAMAQLPGWVRLSVNLDTEDLAGPGSLHRVVEQAAAFGVPAGRLVLELTETMLMRDVAQVTQSLAAVRRLGVMIAVDDFGVGSSSLRSVSELPIDVLKVDAYFVAAARRGHAPREVLRAIAGLGPALGIRTVVEGVEEPADLELATDLGFTHAQGWLVGLPSPVEDLVGHPGLAHPSRL